MGKLLGKLSCLSVYILMILQEHPSKGQGAQGTFLKIVNQPVSSAGANEKILQPNWESLRLTGQCPGFPLSSRAREVNRAEQGNLRAGCYGSRVRASAKGPRRGTLPMAAAFSSASAAGQVPVPATAGCCPGGVAEAASYFFAWGFPLKDKWWQHLS